MGVALSYAEGICSFGVSSGGTGAYVSSVGDETGGMLGRGTSVECGSPFVPFVPFFLLEENTK